MPAPATPAPLTRRATRPPRHRCRSPIAMPVARSVRPGRDHEPDAVEKTAGAWRQLGANVGSTSIEPRISNRMRIGYGMVRVDLIAPLPARLPCAGSSRRRRAIRPRSLRSAKGSSARGRRWWMSSSVTSMRARRSAEEPPGHARAADDEQRESDGGEMEQRLARPGAHAGVATREDVHRPLPTAIGLSLAHGRRRANPRGGPRWTARRRRCYHWKATPTPLRQKLRPDTRCCVNWSSRLPVRLLFVPAR